MKCKHLNRRVIFGDEINHVSGKVVRRQRCLDCGRALSAGVDPKGITGAAFQDTDVLLAQIDEVLNELPGLP